MLGGYLIGGILLLIVILFIIMAFWGEDVIKGRTAGILAVLAIPTLLIPLYFGVISAESRISLTTEYVAVYQRQLDNFNSDMGVIASLNPEAALLVNRDSPISASIEAKSDVLRLMRRMEKDLLDDKAFLRQVEFSIFGFMI
jgi:hypothetical protein